MATTQPTPEPANPTTDSEETPPTTNQQTQEPTDPLTTDSIGDIQATDSEGAGTELRVPTTSETATDLPIQSSQSGSINIGLIIGSAAAGVVVTVLILTLTVVIFVAILLKKPLKTKKMEGYPDNNVAGVPTTSNQAYGLDCHDHSQSGVEENIYNYPKVDLHTIIEAKQNDSEAYVTHSKFNIPTEGNQAYGTNGIMTEMNSAYGQVETAGEYDYII
jgi:hypothetical protein